MKAAMAKVSVKKGHGRVLHFCVSVVLILAMLTAASVCCFASAPEQRVIRVGYIRIYGFLYQDEDGQYSGLAHDLLHEIAAYNNWKYELVETNYKDMPSLLDSGEIDVFIPYQRDEQREKLYEYSDEIFCTNRSSLLALPSSPICYNDFENMSGITIGAAVGTRNDERFEQFLAENGCTVNIKADYLDQAAAKKALQNGEIDAFVSSSNRGVADCKIISVLPETDSYVIAKKGNREILDKFDSALDQISIDMPSLRDSLSKEYQISEDGTYPSLSREEVDYIADKKNVTVMVGAQECDADGEFTGSAKTVFEEMTRLTGLTFTPVIKSNMTEIYADFARGQTDIMYSFNHDYDWAAMHNAWITQSYADFFNKIVTTPGKNGSGIKTVAVVPGSYVSHYVQQQLGYDTINFSSYQDCIEAVLDGKADATYCNSPIGNYYSTFPKYRSLSFLSAYDFSGSYCMAVSMSSDAILVEILNKALSCIPKAMLSEAFELQMASRPVTLVDTFYSNPVLSVVVIVGAVVVLLAMVFLFIYTANIRIRNRKLAIASRAKTDFLARMSHDLRTPLNGMLGLIHLSKTETDILALKENLRQMELSGKYLLELINDMLDMNEIESGRLEIHTSPINSEDVFGNVLAIAKLMAEEKGVELELDLPNIRHGEWISVVTDASRLEQILLNIISNAVKFTPAGGKVVLSMETVSTTGGIVCDKYIIRDNGIGMSEEFLPHLFEPFSQEGRVTDSAEEGAGLGMAIASKLVKLMGGEISVKSRQGEGTVVTVIMEYPICEKLPASSEPPAERDVLAGKRVLVCEDHPLNAQIVANLLLRKGMQPELAENGRLGADMFEASAEFYYDAVLMDIRMPVMDGLEAAKAIRALDRRDAGTVPIIAMTANAYEYDRENSLLAGMNEHLAKPVDVALLFQTLSKFITEAEHEQGKTD